MPRRVERRNSHYSARQLYELVADVEKYPEFLPWIRSSRIQRREGNAVWVDMSLGLQLLHQRFDSKAVLDPPRAIHIESHDAPFEHFDQQWRFLSDEHGRTEVVYECDFRLRSLILSMIPALLFEEAVGATVDAFERRARQIYGPPPAAPTGAAGNPAQSGGPNSRAPEQS